MAGFLHGWVLGCNYVGNHVSNHVSNRVGNHVSNHVGNHVSNRVSNRVSNYVGNREASLVAMWVLEEPAWDYIVSWLREKLCYCCVGSVAGL